MKQYLGDGVYVEFDGYCIWLLANDPDSPSDRICLEPTVFNALIEFVRKAGKAVFDNEPV